LYALALSLFLAPAGVSASLLLLWLGFVLAVAVNRPPPLNTAVLLTGAFVVYCLLHPLLVPAPQHAGEPLLGAGSRWQGALDWAQLAAFVPVAYALRGDSRRLMLLSGLALAGLLLGMLWRMDWALAVQGFTELLESRPGFGFTAIAFALYAGTALLGLVLLRRRCWSAADGRVSTWRAGLWVVAVLVVFQGFMLAQSRGAWLGLGAALLVALIANRRGPGGPHEAAAGADGEAHAAISTAIPRRALLIGLAAFVLLALLNAEQIAGRFVEEAGIVRALASGELDYSQTSSLSLRWHAQLFGLGHWLAHPWLGLGPGASGALLEASGDPALRDAGLGVLQHLHNTYLEVLVQLGAIGLALLLGVFLSLLGILHRAVHGGRLARDIGVFLLSALVFVAIWNLFNFRALNQDFRAYWALLAGAALSFGLYPRGEPAAGNDTGSEPGQ
jgi:O-antigen ligase